MRVKTGFKRTRRHHKVLSRTKGMRMTKNRLYHVAQEADLHAGQYAFVGRKRRKRDFRKLWITRISGALKTHEISYSVFMKNLKTSGIDLNRKMIAEIALNDPETFQSLIKQISSPPDVKNPA